MDWHVTKRLALALAMGLLTACTADNEGNGGKDAGTDRKDARTDAGSRPGMGTSKEAPVGTAFTLPTGLELELPLKGYESEDPIDCDEKYEDQAEGTGSDVALCLIFRNTTGAPITLVLPPGLIFVARDKGTQNGIIVQRIAVQIPAGGRYFLPLLSYCLNFDRDTSAPSDTFDVGPVTQYSDFQELFRLLETKQVKKKDYGNIQSIVGKLSTGQTLDADDHAELNALSAAP